MRRKFHLDEPILTRLSVFRGYQCQTKTAGGWPWESFMLGCTQPCTGREVHSYTATGGRRTTETCGPGGGNNAYSIQIRFRQADIVSRNPILLRQSFWIGRVTDTSC